jgi:adenosylhomocysteine nucleosidase
VTIRTENTSSQSPAADWKIAVTFALPQESRDFVAKLQDVRLVRRGTLPVIAGRFGQKQIAICHTGVGEDSCRAQITGFLQIGRPDFLISSGFAGGLDPALKVGDILIARNFSSDNLLSRLTLQDGIIGTLTTQSSVAETVAQKTDLSKRTGASAVDMETALIFDACSRRGIPMLALRGISDAARDQMPVPFSVWFDASKQKPRIAALLWRLALHPFKIPGFTQFVKGISFTRLRLTDAIAQAVEKL